MWTRKFLMTQNFQVKKLVSYLLLRMHQNSCVPIISSPSSSVKSSKGIITHKQMINVLLVVGWEPIPLIAYEDRLSKGF